MADQLLQTLLSRPQPTGPDPNQPAGTGDEGITDKLMSLVNGGFGVGPDNRWNRAGALLTAGAPLLGAAKLPRILEELFAAKPEARAIYEAAQKAQQTGLANQDTAALRRLSWLQRLHGIPDQVPTASPDGLTTLQRANNAMTDLDTAGVARPIPTENGFQIAIPKDQAKATGKTVYLNQGSVSTSPRTSLLDLAPEQMSASELETIPRLKSTFRKNKDAPQFTKEMRWKIKSMPSFEDVVRSYPNVDVEILRKLRSRG